jgi:hypothetical protein
MPPMAPRCCDRHHSMSLLSPDAMNPKAVSLDGAARLRRRSLAALPKPAMEKGRPGGRPFHCRAVVRLNYRKDVVFRRPGPPRRQGSSSRMPATAAIDNETLDHLLSMTDLALAALGRPALAMFHDWRRQRLPDAASRGPARDTICARPASHRWSQYSIRDRIRTRRRADCRIGSSALCGVNH